jgi:hypothetical protein
MEDGNGSTLYSMGQRPRYIRYNFTNRTLYKRKNKRTYISLNPSPPQTQGGSTTLSLERRK